MVLVAALCLFSQAASPVKLDVQIRPFAELYFTTVRSAHAADSGKERPTTQGPSLLALSLVDSTAIASDSTESFLEACKGLPERLERGGQAIEVRRIGVELAEALGRLSADERKAAFEGRRERLESKKREIEGAFGRSPGLFKDAFASLDIPDKEMTIPLVIVSSMPSPGAATYRRSAEQAICVVGVGDLAGTQLLETVLHEALHAADFAAAKNDTALTRLRLALQEAKVNPKVAAECVHAVIFAQAAATVRKVVDSKHVPVGEKKGGAYERMGKPAKETVAIWTDRCSGKLDVKAAVEKIVEAAKAGTKSIAKR